MRITGGEGIDLAFDAQGPKSFRKDYRLLRPGGRLVMYGLAEASTGEGRSIPKLIGSLARMPTATMPVVEEPQVMNENKGVFGLNMLAWWDKEGSVERITGPLLERDRGGRTASRSSPSPSPSSAPARRTSFIAERQEHRQGRAGSLSPPRH